MKRVDLYTDFLKSFEKTKKFSAEITQDARYTFLINTAQEWGVDLQNVERWMNSPEYRNHRAVAESFMQLSDGVFSDVSKTLGRALIGQVNFSPSFMTFDGFARYDRAHHTVWIGVDHPDADEKYLMALLAHELSHVFRDHQPEVWREVLEKIGREKLEDFTRKDYLESVSAEEHLVSEGLATLFSQLIYPDIDLQTHHFYLPEELNWCFQNSNQIDLAIRDCIKGDQNVWKFYEEGAAGEGSPSRVQYFWAAQKLRAQIEVRAKIKGISYSEELINSHGYSATGLFEGF